MSEPETSYREFERFWDEAAERRLSFPRCTGCGTFHWYPMKRCPECRGQDIVWQPVSELGRVYSWTTVRHPFDRKLAAELPYIVALVEFPDAPGVRLVTNIVGVPPEGMSIGLEVRPDFARFEHDRGRLCFGPA